MNPEEKSQNAGAVPVNEHTAMGVLSYIGPLVFIPMFTSKDPFVRFHVKQGLVLFIIEVALWFIGAAIWVLWPIIELINILVVILIIVGIMNVVKNRQKALPFVGGFAKYLNF